MAILRVDWSPVLDYTERMVTLHAPSDGGVYCLYYQSGSERKVFYVGQAPSLMEGLRGHLAATEPNPCIKQHLQGYKCSFRYAKIGNRFAEETTIANRNGAERALYERYRPGCNDVPQTADAVEINF